MAAQYSTITFSANHRWQSRRITVPLYRFLISHCISAPFDCNECDCPCNVIPTDCNTSRVENCFLLMHCHHTRRNRAVLSECPWRRVSVGTTSGSSFSSYLWGSHAHQASWIWHWRQASCSRGSPTILDVPGGGTHTRLLGVLQYQNNGTQIKESRDRASSSWDSHMSREHEHVLAQYVLSI